MPRAFRPLPPVKELRRFFSYHPETERIHRISTSRLGKAFTLSEPLACH